MYRFIAAVVIVACAVRAQEKPAVPDSLEAALAVAMQSHPDVLLAEAKLRQAEAEVMQARLKAAREVVELWNGRRIVAAEHASARRTLERSRTLFDKGALGQAELDATEDRVIKTEVAMSNSEVALRGLMGLMNVTPASGWNALTRRTTPVRFDGATAGFGGTGGPPAPDAGRPSPAVEETPVVRKRPELAVDLRQRLDVTISVDLTDVPLGDAVARVLKGIPVNLVLDPNDRGDLDNTMVTLALKDVSVRAALVALLDQTQFALVHREYGFRLTNVNRAVQMVSPTIPDSIPLDG